MDTGGHSGSPTEPKARKSAGKRCGTTLSGAHRIFTRRRSLVRVQQSPPHMKNPNFFPIGNAFGFFIFIKDNSYRYLRPEEFYILRTFYPHIRFLPLGITTIKKEHHLFCGRQWTLSVNPAAGRVIRPHERLFPSDPPIPPTNPPFPAHSAGKGGFLIHPQNFSCSPLTIPLS